MYLCKFRHLICCNWPKCMKLHLEEQAYFKNWKVQNLSTTAFLKLFMISQLCNLFILRTNYSRIFKCPDVNLLTTLLTMYLIGLINDAPFFFDQLTDGFHGCWSILQLTGDLSKSSTRITFQIVFIPNSYSSEMPLDCWEKKEKVAKHSEWRGWGGVLAHHIVKSQSYLVEIEGWSPVV